MGEFPCLCGHSLMDHKEFELGFHGWCRYSEYRECPCDVFTVMNNLEYLEYEATRQEL